MALEMSTSCLQCHVALVQDGDAFICSYECTFCRGCAESMGRVCPNCRGELVIRPRRIARSDA